MKQVGGLPAAAEEAAAAFRATAADLRSGRDQLCGLRPELSFEDVPAPRTLAPFSTALGAGVQVAGADVAAGRFVLLYDPAGQHGWQGPLRVIVYVRADLEPEVAADALLGEVAWSWLTESLETHTTGYAAPSGTVSRVVTEGFGAKRGEPQVTGFELRASWSPLVPAGPAGEPDLAGAELAGHTAAWCETLCAAAGLPPLVAGVATIRPPARRRGL